MNTFLINRSIRCIPNAARNASTLVSSFESSIAKIPIREAVRYTKKNMKWTADEFRHFTDSHANYWIDHDFKAGETVAVWFPDCAEKHVVLMTAAKLGLHVVEIDNKLREVSDLRTALKLADAKMIYFDHVDDTHDKLKQLRKTIPEFFHYDDQHGQLFHSKYFPSLRFFVQSGFDVQIGCLTYKGCFLPNPLGHKLKTYQEATSDDQLLYSHITKDSSGKIVKSSYNHGEVLALEQWYFAKKIVQREYFEVDA